MKCKCGFENVDGAVFCAECGAALTYDNVEQTKNNPKPAPSPYKGNPPVPGKGVNKNVVVIVVSLVIIALIAATVVVIVMKSRNNGNSAGNNSNPVNSYSEDNGYNNYYGDYEGYDNNYGIDNNNYQVNKDEHTYEVIKMDCTWTQALNECKNRGGHLATITSVEEYNKICNLADQVDGLKYIWLGAQVNAGSTNWSNAWITGENWTFEKWYQNEPSGYDVDGTVENCLCMWNVKQNNTYIGWTFNDQRNDLISALSTISGKIGFVCEYE